MHRLPLVDEGESDRVPGPLATCTVGASRDSSARIQVPCANSCHAAAPFNFLSEFLPALQPARHLLDGRLCRANRALPAYHTQERASWQPIQGTPTRVCGGIARPHLQRVRVRQHVGSGEPLFLSMSSTVS